MKESRNSIPTLTLDNWLGVDDVSVSRKDGKQDVETDSERKDKENLASMHGNVSI